MQLSQRFSILSFKAIENPFIVIRSKGTILKIFDEVFKLVIGLVLFFPMSLVVKVQTY